MRKQKASLQRELQVDRQNLQRVTAKIQAGEQKQDMMMNRVNELERRKDGYESIIEKGEEAYHKITENSGKLVSCIENYCDGVGERYLR